jgi:AcrR family transcriptional regulator
MHHFPSREALIHAVAEHVTDRMWEEVRAHIDLSENRAGKFTRAYVRAMTGGSDYLTRMYSPTSLMAATVITPELDALYERDAHRLHTAFAADRQPLPHERRTRTGPCRTSRPHRTIRCRQ